MKLIIDPGEIKIGLVKLKLVPGTTENRLGDVENRPW